MTGEKTGHPPRRVVFVIEGGRSRDDVAALRAVARAVAQAGAQVELVRHGLGKLSTLQVQRAVRRANPDLLIVTGATSTRHLQSLAARLGCLLVAYYWPSAAVIDIHRRPRRASPRPSPPDRGRALPLPQRAVLGSEQQRHELLALLPQTGRRTTLSDSGIHILPPLLDPILFAADEPTRAAAAAAPRLGVYGALATQLPAWAAPAEVVLLDGTPAHLRPTAHEATTEAQRLLTCTGVLVSVQNEREAREAARHVMSALVLGKPVLLCGYGERGRDLPAILAALALPEEILRAAPRDELARELPRFTQQLLSATRAQSAVPIDARLQQLRQTLQPARVLAEHVALILELADLAAEDAADRARPTLGQHARALGLRLFRRPALLCLRYPRVVAELRGRDLSGLITLDTLERQLETLLQAGYQPVSPTAFARLSKPTLRRGQRFLTVTFADGLIPDASPGARLAPAAEPARVAALLARLGIPSPGPTPADEPEALQPISLSEQSSRGTRGRFDAHRLWLTLAQRST